MVLINESFQDVIPNTTCELNHLSFENDRKKIVVNVDLHLYINVEARIDRKSTRLNSSHI